jgi:vitamin B12 transporter
MPRRHPVSRLSVSLLALMIALPATAQDGGETDVLLDEIVVTANRTALAANRTGSSITVIDRPALERAGDQTIATYLSRIPGVQVTRSGPAGTETKLRIRGASPRYTAVYIDGVRVDDPTGIAAEFDFGTLRTDDIARVEVLRGSQSALYGGSAIAGVVNITTNRAEEPGFTQSVAVEAGSYSTAAASYSLGYSDDRWSAALTLSTFRTDGFSAFDTLPRTPGLEDDGLTSRRLSFSSSYRVNEILTVGLNGSIGSSEAEYDDFGADALNRTDKEERSLSTYAEWDLGSTQHEIRLSSFKVDRDLIEPGGSGGFFYGERLSVSYQGMTELSQAFTLVYGADTNEETATTSAQTGGQKTGVSGVFAQGIWSPSNIIDVSATLRLDENNRYGSFTSGRIAASWRPSESLTLRGAVARGFRAPSLYEQFGDPRFGIAPNPNLTPERSKSYELGVDYNSANGASFSATAFALDTENEIGFGANYINVVGVSKRTGLELEARFPVLAVAELGMAYTYTDAKQPNGTAIPRVPEHLFSLSVDGELTEGVTGSLAVRHVAGRPIDGFPARDMPDFTVVDAKIGYELSENAELSLRIDNLFDEEYQEIADYGTSERAVYVGVSAKF